jgi:hypothetical protein
MADTLTFPKKSIRHFEPTRLDDILSLAADNDVRPLAEPGDGNAVLHALAICANAPKPALSELPDAAWVIGAGMRWITRRGRKRSSLPTLVGNLLDQHCDAGDPAALLFRDWIDCRLPDSLRDPDQSAPASGQPLSAVPAISRGGE